MIAVVEPVPAPGVGHVLRRAVRDFYEESWRLVLLNGALSAYVLFVLGIAAAFPPLLVLLLGAGPLAAALVYAAATVVETGSLTFVETFEGLRRCWRRGLGLAAADAAFVVLTIIAVRFYAGGSSLAWPLAVLAVYIGGMVAVFQLLLWPLAVRDYERPFREVLGDAATTLLRRPVAAVGLAFALLVVNLVGLAAAVLPFLTMTIAYSALAAARFALPPRPPEEA
jgi:hypothetical protein